MHLRSEKTSIFLSVGGSKCLLELNGDVAMGGFSYPTQRSLQSLDVQHRSMARFKDMYKKPRRKLTFYGGGYVTCFVIIQKDKSDHMTPATLSRK